MNDEITVLDLFSGIGGFSLGLESAGPFRTVAFCEQDSFCQAVLRKHWPNVPIYDDVRTIPTDGLGRIDIIVGGFPCQPWSQAGQQRGAADDRDLWPAMAALVEELRPKYLIGENVRGFVSQPMGLERSLSDLESLGYQAVPFVIPACAVDAPHRRDRVWIISWDANSSNGTAQCKIRTENTKPSRICTRSPASVANAVSERQREKRRTKSRRRISGASSSMADTDNAKRGRGKVGRSGWDRQSSLHGEIGAVMADSTTPRLSHGRSAQVHRPETESKPERRSRWATEPGMGGMVDGVPGWLDEPDTPRVAIGIKNRVARLKALGNAVVPSVVAQIGKAILAAEDAG